MIHYNDYNITQYNSIYKRGGQMATYNQRKTAWAKKAAVAMIEQGLTPKDIAQATGRCYTHTVGVLNGRIVSDTLRREISDYLRISDE